MILLHVEHDVKLEELYDHIIQLLNDRNVPIPEHDEVDVHSIQLVTRTQERLENLREIARSKGGECLSMTYINNHTPMRFRCKEGHEWPTLPFIIASGSWCKWCAQPSKLSIEKVNAYMEPYGIKTVSKVYERAKGKLDWVCLEAQHHWNTSYDNIHSRIREGRTACKFCKS